jgi:hypothetical protein
MLRAVPITIIATGKVDKLFIGLRFWPMMPPIKIIKTLSDMKSDKLKDKIHTLRGSLCMWLIF